MQATPVCCLWKMSHTSDSESWCLASQARHWSTVWARNVFISQEIREAQSGVACTRMLDNMSGNKIKKNKTAYRTKSPAQAKQKNDEIAAHVQEIPVMFELPQSANKRGQGQR